MTNKANPNESHKTGKQGTTSHPGMMGDGTEEQNLGQPGNPLHPDGLAAFFDALRKQGFSQAEIDLMSKTNPARALGLQ